MKVNSRIRGMGRRLHDAFLRSGKTAAQVQKETGIGKSSFYEHLKGGAMSPLYLAKYCIALNVSADFLLGIEKEGKR